MSHVTRYRLGERLVPDILDLLSLSIADSCHIRPGLHYAQLQAHQIFSHHYACIRRRLTSHRPRWPTTHVSPLERRVWSGAPALETGEVISVLASSDDYTY